jgi:predicted DsbA family dithiol-disulfide isomerase
MSGDVRSPLPVSKFPAAYVHVAAVGIEFKFKDRYFPTALAHALVEFADTKGKQVRTTEASFNLCKNRLLLRRNLVR